MTHPQASAVIDRYRRGQSVRFIALALGMAHQTVSAVLRENGVEVRKAGRPASGNWGWKGGFGA